MHCLRLGGLRFGLHFYSVPIRQSLVGVGSVFVAEDMRVADNQLFTDTVTDIVYVKAVYLAFHLRVKRYLEKYISELFLQQSFVVGVDSLYRLVGLLDQIGADGLMGLRPVPRTILTN